MSNAEKIKRLEIMVESMAKQLGYLNLEVSWPENGEIQQALLEERQSE